MSKNIQAMYNSKGAIMKKKICVSALASLIITLVLFIIDTIGALSKSHSMLIQREYSGGECVVYRGVGWIVTRLYPMTDSNKGASHNNCILNFDFISLLAIFVVAWLIIWLILCILGKSRKTALLVIGSIVACYLIFLGGRKAISNLKDAPQELQSISIYTSDLNSGSYYMIQYPNKAYSFVDAGDHGRYGHTEDISLNIQPDKVSKSKLRKLVKAANKLQKDSELSSKSSNFAFRVEIVYKVNGRYKYHNKKKERYKSIKFNAYSEYPESWESFASIVNEICGGEYLSMNPEVTELSKEWFCDAYGIYEKDMPSGGNLDEFLFKYIGNIKPMCGINKNGNMSVFNVTKTLNNYKDSLETEAEAETE